jgi:hypothetical protein
VNKVILNWQRSLWEGDQEVVKRYGRDEPMRVVIYMCREAMLGISLYRYPYLKLAKTLCLSYYCLSSLQQNWRKGLNRFCLEVESGGGPGGVGKGERWPKHCIHI